MDSLSDMSIVALPSPGRETLVEAESVLPLGQADFTQSQFGQVIFLDLQDGSNIQDLTVKYSFSSDLLTPSETLDRISLYRVPALDHNESLATVKVDKHDLTVVFMKEDLPQESDFYQLQYLRGGSSVMGASIPFRLSASFTSPATHELTTVEDEEDFQLVTSVADRQMEQYKNRLRDCERKYSDLLEISERLTEDLTQKQETLTMVTASQRQLALENATIPDLKRDLCGAIEEKVALAEQLGTLKEQLTRVEQKMKCSLAEQDELRGQLQRGRDESELKADDLKQKLEKREDLLKGKLELERVCHQEDLAKLIAEKNAALNKVSKEKEEKVLEALNVGTTTANKLRADLAREQEQSKTLKKALDGINKRFDRMEKTCFDLKRTLEDTLEEKRILKDNRDGLEADLVKANEARLVTLQQLQALQQRYAGEPNSSFMAPPSVMASTSGESMNLEQRLRELKDELQQTELDSGEDTETLYSSPARSEVTSSERNLDSMVIEQALRPAVVPEQEPSSLGSFYLPLDYQPVVSQPGTSSPLIPFCPATQTQSSPPRGDESFTTLEARNEREYTADLQELEAWARSTQTTRDEPLTSVVIDSQPAAATPVAIDGSLLGGPIDGAFGGPVSGASPSSFTLTDDGTPVPDEPLKCMMCPAEFKPGCVRELEFHVDSHLVQSLECPVCKTKFEKDDQCGYETHVQSHFPEEEGEDNEHPTVLGAPSAPVVAGPGFLGNWDLDID